MKKILWICGVEITPEGGFRAAPWVEAACEYLTQEKALKLVTVSASAAVRVIRCTQMGESLCCFQIPLRCRDSGRVCKKTTDEIFALIEEVKPDIIQIFGTEVALDLSAMYAAHQAGMLHQTVVWIQGLCSLIGREYCKGLPVGAVLRFTLRDFLRMDTICLQKQKFLRRGKNEREMLQMSAHVIGRTDWDHAYMQSLACRSVYHHCSETLRSDFYTGVWGWESCEKWRIFVSQGWYPVKGLHMLLRALPEIIREYPLTKVYVAGDDPLNASTCRARFSRSSYSVYLKLLIRRLHLEDHVVFTGNLSAAAIREQYLKTHVFVLPSAVENSPNSLGEAMLLGVPCVAADVGGVAGMLRHGSEGFLYEQNAEYLLAYYVMRIFADRELACELGANASVRARVTHDPHKNAEQLLKIYAEILEGA